jgi:hypothetical protein
LPQFAAICRNLLQFVAKLPQIFAARDCFCRLNPRTPFIAVENNCGSKDFIGPYLSPPGKNNFFWFLPGARQQIFAGAGLSLRVTRNVIFTLN